MKKKGGIGKLTTAEDKKLKAHLTVAKQYYNTETPIF